MKPELVYYIFSKKWHGFRKYLVEEHVSIQKMVVSKTYIYRAPAALHATAIKAGGIKELRNETTNQIIQGEK